ncbi:MAG: CPBP family intramembrane metalloprotease [Deltaproteobacteria bacterium]|nr:CPBP family intramembrane metalloprotease [Deltaproteobacteria bacterium]
MNTQSVDERRSLFDALFLEPPNTDPSIGTETIPSRGTAEVEQFRVRRLGGESVGPLSTLVIVRLLVEGAFTASLEVCVDGQDAWVPAGSLPAFANAIHLQTSTSATRETPAFAPSFRGVLDDNGVFSALLLASRKKETGWLRFKRNEVEVLVSFRQGTPTSVVSTDPAQSDEQLLLEDFRVNETQLQVARSFASKHGLGVLAALVETKAISAESVPKMLSENASLRLMSLLLWDAGEMRFDLDFSAGQAQDELKGNLMEVCKRAFDALDERDLVQAVGPLNALVSKNNSSSEVETLLEESEKQFLLRFEKKAPLSECIDTESEDELRQYYWLAALRLVDTGDDSHRVFKKFALHFLAQPDLVVLGVGPDASLSKLQESIAKVETDVDKATEAHQEHPLAKQMRTRIQGLRARMADPVKLEVMRRANSMGLDPDDAGVRLALETEYLHGQLIHLFSTQNFSEALETSNRLSRLLPNDIDTKALHLQAKAHVCQSATDAKLLMHEIDELANAYPSNANVLAAGVVATSLFKEANVDAWYSRLKAQAPAHPLIERRLQKKGAKKKKDSVEVDYDFFRTLGIAAGAFVLLWGASVGLNLGSSEGAWSGTSVFWWVRRVALIAIAIVGWTQVNDGGPGDFFKVKWLESPKVVGIGIIIGLISGLLSGTGSTETALPVLIVLAMVHVLAEQLFFIWFVLRSLLAHVKHPLIGVVTTAVLYGLYHTTYHFYFTQILPSTLVYWIVLFILGGGVPYALLYAKNRTVIPALICHLLVQIIAVAKWT